MDQKKDRVSKQDEKSENNVSRTQSQDALDSSSTSSLSFFADHSDAQISYPHENEKSTDGQKSGECSPRPPMDEALKSEKAFIEFVMSLPPKESSEHHHTSTDSVMSKTKIPTSASSNTKVGLDHLDNLCKLMEQLSELRETNNKLQRRVQYLEDLKTLHDMHKEISEEGQYSSEDALACKPRRYELQKSATETYCPEKENIHVVHSARTHSKYLSRRGRAQSTDGQRRERSKSVGHEDTGEDTKSKRIFPKWSKVKEAFGWESDRKDSVKMRSEVETGTVRSPRRCSDESEVRSHQHYHRSNSPTWSQDFPSLHSSLEDVNEILESGRWKRTSVASEKNVTYLDTPKECLRRLKSTPSPGSEKFIPSKEISDLKPKSSTIERDSYSHQDYNKFERDDGKRGKSPWGRVKTIIEKRRDSLKRRSIRREHTCIDCDPTHQKKTPEVAEMKSYIDNVESSFRQQVITEPHKHKHHHAPDPIIIDEEVDYRGPRTPSSSPTFHRKSRWTRVKKALTGKKEDDHDQPSSTPASPNTAQDGHFTFDPVEEITQDTYDDGREIKRVGSDSHVHELSLSAPACDLMLQLQRNLSEDFHRKIMEWERIRSSGHVSCSPQWDRKPSMTTRSRKKSERDDKNIKPKLKDLTWLEKELQKIEKEKQRLSKERQKYEERALRLEKLKETVLSTKNSNKREVFVRTSAGEFRFEGISDAFTKKLYEWETKRGLGPELSTIALLDSSRLTVQSSIGPKSGPLQRVVSRSESSIADLGGQPSHNSSNSLPSLKIPDTIDADRTNQPSRANSEPDLSTLAAFTNGNNDSVNTLSQQVQGSLEDEIANTGVNRESEEDELDKKRNDSETYYSLLEENVILLEQLKDKEEICSRLQKELEMLDKKVDVMDKHHTQETERYREKLWEMHKPGATPRDVQCCLQTMSQLQQRIDTLEKCTEKLRLDRESVEDSFRYHSKQQEDMTLDLLQKMSELQAAGSSTADCETQEYFPPRMNASVVERLQDLSALLVQQTQELQKTLSTKTRQICQLRWELLHRDLSTVKLETELHTHTAHRKRSKYAHYRSHSSEEAPVVPLPQELECGKSTLMTEAYYNIAPENDFQAKELTNTVQQLNKEVLKLANAKECLQDHNQSEIYRAKSNNEKPWVKSNIQPRSTDKSKQITVRRSSADNVGVVLGKGERWKQNESSDSDDSSDDGYTKISLHPATRNNCLPNTERLLMSSGEHPPRGYLQRRKKLQKQSKSGTSPNRRRSKTFHNKRDFEKPVVLDNTPQKYYSFRLPAERNINYSDSRKVSDTVNIRNLLGEVKYREFLKKRAQLCKNSIGQEQFSIHKNSQTEQDSMTDSQWLREVASDSKIPLLFQLQCRNDELFRNKLSNRCPVRSFSDKHAKETAAERRENFQKRKVRRHLTSPDLFSNLNEILKARILSKTPSQSKILKDDEYNCNSNKNVNTQHQRKYSEKSSSASNIPKNNGDATVTIQLPKRKSRKIKPKVNQDSFENTEHTFTIVMPKKRSLSSEKEYDNSYKNISNLKSDEHSREIQSYNKYENQAAEPLVDLKLYSEENVLNDSEVSKNTMVKVPELIIFNATESGRQQIEKITRKRKAEDSNSLSRSLTKAGKEVLTDQYLNAVSQNDQNTSLGSDKENIPAQYSCSYIKSTSAPQLDWRKGCAKKITKESASNVRSLIEKYNKVAESQQFKSPNSSNLSSPTWNRKISAPLHMSRSDHVIIPSYSSSTPTTPSIISASAFYNPLIFKPVNLDLFPKSAPESPLSVARAEAIRRAKEQFIASQTTSLGRIESPSSYTLLNSSSNDENSSFVNNVTHSSFTQTNINTKDDKRTDVDRLSNCSMDSTNLVMFRTGETCQESRLSKRSAEYSRTESDTLERRNNLKTSKSLSNSSIFKSVLSSDFKIPSSLLKLRRSKRKKDMTTVTQLCRQSLLLTTEDTGKVSSQLGHKSCPSSPELKTKSEIKSNWFHRNILRHK